MTDGGIRDLKTFLSGKWRITRTITDRGDGQNGHYLGDAEFTPHDDGLFYAERGQLILPGHQGPAVQSYVYALTDPARAEVRFTDGRPFHSLDLSRGRWQTTHDCPPDVYGGSFEVENAEGWRVRWTVTGRRKDLTIDTHYRRA